MKGYDIIGNIAIVKFGRNESASVKKKIALELLKEHKNVRTILEKSARFSGRLRTQKTKFIAGEKTKEALYKENGCEFRLNVDTCYFSPRLSSERLEIAKAVKKGERVLVMFGGVAPFAIVIAKAEKAGKVISVELGRECSKYALVNAKRNKVADRVEIIQGDVRKKVPKMKGRFDRIVMARPNLKDSFLDVAFPRIKKGGIIYYYGFTENKKFSVPKTLKRKKRVLGYAEDEVGEIRGLIEREAKKARRKIKILRVKKAGDIGIKKYRYRADVKVLN